MASPTSTSKSALNPEELPTLFGHPTALFTLFFAEMWERFSYYGMRALLVFYMIKGFLGYNDAEAYRIYGAYAGMVYMTPFFGGMIADRFLGARRAVVLGGFLMALGHLTMTIENELFFFMALALLIVGNGFFKPNISTMVGSLYTERDPRRDGGFTLFYMGINLGAALAPLLCGYVGETYGWHYGFGLATIGMMVGLAVFVVPTRIAQGLILVGALFTSIAMVGVVEGALLLAVNGFVALALLVSAVVAFMALGKGGLPAEAGQAPNPAALKETFLGIPKEYAVYLGGLLIAPVFAVLTWSNRDFKVIPESVFEPLTQSTSAIANVAGTVLAEMSSLPGMILLITGLVATSYLLLESFRSSMVERQRLWVIVVLMGFSMLFWAFFEQGGSSMNNFTDRNVDRVQQEWDVSEDKVGTTASVALSQDQLGMVNADPAMKQQIVAALRELDGQREVPADATDQMMAKLGLEATILSVLEEPALTITGLDALRELEKLREKLRKKDAPAEAVQKTTTVQWKFDESNVGMGIGGNEIPASTFQSANAIFIVLFGLLFTGAWSWLGARGKEPSTPVKFGLGLLQLGLGFGVLWYGAQIGDTRGMSGMSWLLLGYLLFTTGELCLSPVGLSMVTKLSPARLVSTSMGAWFLATAFSSLLASIIATFTGVGHGSGGTEGDLKTCAVEHCSQAGSDLGTCALEYCGEAFRAASAGIPVPSQTLHIYGDVFGVIALLIGVATLVMFALSPLLTKWMHVDVSESKDAAG